MLRFVVAMVVAAHGVGHILFLVPLLGIADWGQSTRSWLLPESAARVIGSLIWLIATLAFLIAVVGLFGQQDWWRSAAIVAAVVSLVGLGLFWSTPPTSSVIFALIVDVLVLVALLVVHWPPPEAVGA